METADIGLNSRAFASADVAKEAQLDALYKKLMYRIVPFLFAAFLLAWIDRVNVSFTKLQINQHLGFTEAIYGFGAGIFFIGYFLFEIPSNLMLQRFGVRFTVSRIAIIWGLACIALAWMTTPLYFYVVRFILGAAEAGLWPGIVLYLTYWFPAARRLKALALIGCASSVSGIVGGPLAGWIMEYADGWLGHAGWQWVFILEGVPTVLLGVMALWILCDRPETASILTETERSLLLADLKKDNATAGTREHSFFKCLMNKKVWAYITIYFCIIMGQSAIIFWAPTMLRNVGFQSPTTIGYIMSGAFLIGLITVILNGLWASKTNKPHLHSGLALIVAAAACVMLAIFLAQNSKLIILAIYIGLPAVLCSIPVFWQLPNTVLVGTAAAAGIAMINSIGNLSGFIAPFAMGLAHDMIGQVHTVVGAVAAILLVGGMMTIFDRKAAN